MLTFNDEYIVKYLQETTHDRDRFPSLRSFELRRNNWYKVTVIRELFCKYSNY